MGCFPSPPTYPAHKSTLSYVRNCPFGICLTEEGRETTFLQSNVLGGVRERKEEFHLCIDHKIIFYNFSQAKK